MNFDASMKIIGTLLQWHSVVQNRRTNPDYQVAKAFTYIAFACGFADSNYFSRKFHGLMELPPLEYRRQSRRKDPPFDIVLPQPSESPGQSAP